MQNVSKRIVERKFKVDSRPFCFCHIRIVFARLIFFRIPKLRSTYVYAIKHNRALRPYVATILIALNVFFVGYIGYLIPHVIKLAYLYPINGKIYIANKPRIVAIVVVHPKFKRNFGAIVRISRTIVDTHNRIARHNIAS